jgi:hypothetical protein
VAPSGETANDRTIRNARSNGDQTTLSRDFASPFAPASIHSDKTFNSASDKRCAPTLFCCGGMYGFSKRELTRNTKLPFESPGRNAVPASPPATIKAGDSRLSDASARVVLWQGKQFFSSTGKTSR